MEMIEMEMESQGSDVVAVLSEVVGNTVVLAYKAKGYHWNVEGQDFPEYHAFFEMIYADVDGSLDETAEELRKLGVYAPFKLIDFASLSTIEDSEVGTSCLDMVQDLYAANEVMIGSLDRCFASATAANEQGLADYIAGRISMHKKWRWQMKASLKTKNTMEHEF